MKVLFFANEPEPGPWQRALEDALAQLNPQASVIEWRADAAVPAPLCDYAVCWLPDAAFFAGQSQLKAVFNIGAGADAVLNNPAVPVHLPVIRLDDAGMAAQMEEYVLWCALRVLRRFDAYATQQHGGQWHQLQPRVRERQCIGIMGLGVLGSFVANKLKDFGFAVRGWSRSPRALDGIECFAGDAALAEFLSGCDMLVCLLPLTDSTRGMLNHNTLAQLPQGAHLVNIGRGAHLIEADLLTLLSSGHLGGATLDVFSREPLEAASPLWAHPLVTITPHVSAQTLIGQAMGQIARKLVAFDRGEPVVGLIDRARGY
jgi:glyoxylate/hydroxypyruvate reductase